MRQHLIRLEAVCMHMSSNGGIATDVQMKENFQTLQRFQGTCDISKHRMQQ